MIKKKESDIERILCAANYWDDGNVYLQQPKNIKSGIVVAGLNHPMCKTILRSWLFPNWQTDSIQNLKKIKVNTEEIQGFLTSHRRFVDREEGAKIFIASGGSLNYSSKLLYSEDLY